MGGGYIYESGTWEQSLENMYIYTLIHFNLRHGDTDVGHQV